VLQARFTGVGLLDRSRASVRDLAPDIVRQRLLIEGFFSADVDEAVIREFFAGTTKELGLRTYGKPTIFAAAARDGRRTRATTRSCR